MDFFLRDRWGIFEKQNAHSCEHFIFQNVLSFIIINFPCDTWLGIMGKKWKQKTMLGGGLCWLTPMKKWGTFLFGLFQECPTPNTLPTLHISIIFNKLRATYDVVS